MRTRIIVAIAALIAAIALVAGPGPAGARPSSPQQSIDPAQFRALVIALPSGPPATSSTTTDTANRSASEPGPWSLVPSFTPDALDPTNRSAGWLSPDAPLGEAGETPGETAGRPTAPQPTVAPTTVRIPPPTPKPTAAPAVTVVSSSAWHFDPDISWYGPGFYGGRTACGETLTKTLLGVANRTLPCGTLVTFRNPANGRTVTVPVVDRGPYVTGRTWDMTGGLCTYLSHCYTGTIYWKLAGG